ncbi:hypothetical protein U9M48_042338 [Paspalum notatum var. saurae]|uniref:Uncharacterized protein n=1 Tax=Paspalum notatum var. saurae TaxID=547442 RepID=A0AAQ3UV32_PASNO
MSRTHATYFFLLLLTLRLSLYIYATQRLLRFIHHKHTRKQRRQTERESQQPTSPARSSDLMEKSQRADFLFEADGEAAGGRRVEEDSKAPTVMTMLCWGSSCRPAGQQRKDGSRPPQEARSLPPPPTTAWQLTTKLLPC